MNIDFHYYGTYAAARLAGWPVEDARLIAHAAQYVDDCEKKRLRHIPDGIPTVQSILSLAVHDILWDEPFKREIARVWPVFHFLPANYDEHGLPAIPYQGAEEHASTLSEWHWDEDAENQYRYICAENSPLAAAIVNGVAALREEPYYPHAVGLTMHVLADTWAHMRYAGLPSWFMNTGAIMDKLPEPVFSATDMHDEICWQHDADSPDLEGRDDDMEADEDLLLWKRLLAEKRAKPDTGEPLSVPPTAGEKRSRVSGSREDMLVYWERILDEEGRLRRPVSSLQRDMLGWENVLAFNSYLFLGHSRSRHTPDYPYQIYSHRPQWRVQAPAPNAFGKNNRDHFRLAFLQMIQALECIREQEVFQTGTYAPISQHNDQVLHQILTGAVSGSIQAQSTCWRNFMGGMQVADQQAMEVPPPYDRKAWALAAKNTHDAGGDIATTHAARFNLAAQAHLGRVQVFLNALGMDLNTVPI